MLKTVPITADEIGDRHCAGCGLFVFLLLPLRILLGQASLDLTQTLPSGLFFSNRWEDSVTPRQQNA
jgi:hypothetical protein